MSMCEWRQQHGEGKKWHLNAENFSKEFSKGKAVVETLNEYIQNSESFVGTSPSMNVEMLTLKNDDHFSETVRATKQWFSTFMHARNSGRSCSMLDWHTASSSFKQDTGRPCA